MSRGGRRVGSQAGSLADVVKVVRRAAKSSARAAVDDALVAREAAEAVVQKFEERLLKGRMPDEPAAWARTVGWREALRRASTKKKAIRLTEGQAADERLRHRESTTLPSFYEFQRALPGRWHCLTTKQQRAVRALLRHGSVKAAARAQGRDHRNVRRLLRRAADRLRGPPGWVSNTAAPR